jgi:hypothetical protein
MLSNFYWKVYFVTVVQWAWHEKGCRIQATLWVDFSILYRQSHEIINTVK